MNKDKAIRCTHCQVYNIQPQGEEYDDCLCCGKPLIKKQKLWKQYT